MEVPDQEQGVREYRRTDAEAGDYRKCLRDRQARGNDQPNAGCNEDLEPDRAERKVQVGGSGSSGRGSLAGAALGDR
jgi:hypothetical protein